MADSIPGTRPGTERTAVKQYSVSHLQEKPAAAHARRELYKAVWTADDLFKAGQGKPVPCLADPDRWTGDDLPSDREAQLMCSTCDIIDRCRTYAEVGHVAWGVWGGAVYGRGLQEAMSDDDPVEDNPPF